MHIVEGKSLSESDWPSIAENDLTWIDSADATNRDALAKRLNLDPMLLDTIRRAQNRPLLMTRGESFLLEILARRDRDFEPLFIATGPHWVWTSHQGPIPCLANLIAEVRAGSLSGEVTVSQVVYEILEQVADDYVSMLDKFEERFDQLEDAILEGKNRAREVFEMRRELHELRKRLADQRRVVARLARRQTTAGAPPAYLDVYDAFYHAIDEVDGLRDNLTGLVDLQLNQHSARLNEIMKFLTIFSTIFLPLSFITGFLGMNLRDMPELRIYHGQTYTLTVMALVVAALVALFRKNRWL